MPPIQVLPKLVVDQIAAGEVVQRPASAIKELLENSLDAGATEVAVSVSSPTEFSVSDNGSGIPRDDLPLACTRHATSKLRDSKDLKAIASFGFRGEALASMSMVADVQIVTRTPQSKVGFVQNYKNGEPVSNKPPTPRARPNQGTTIRVSNLFSQAMAHRKKTLRISTEYSLIFKVVESYALHYPEVDFICSKANQPMDLCTRGSSDSRSVVTLIAGKPSSWIDHSCELLESETGDQIYSAKIWMAEMPASSRKTKQPFFLFVNNRLVSNQTIQNSIESLLEANSHLVHVDVHVPPCSVDVNVHPTKQSVVLFHLDTICKHLSGSLQDKLQGEQAIPTMPPSPKNKDKPMKPREEDQDNLATKKRPLLSQQPQPHKVRINSSTGALKPFVTPAKVHDPSCPAFDLTQPGAFVCTCKDLCIPPILKRYEPIQPTKCSYTSIQKLRQEIQQKRKKGHPLKHAVYIGPFSPERSFLQAGPDLILWSHYAAASALFYQLTLARFKGGAAIATVGPIQVQKCVAGHERESAQQVVTCLSRRAAMLEEYFSIVFKEDDDGNLVLTGLPVLLDEHVASPALLPVFLWRLAMNVDYSDETNCFRAVATEVGLYYARSCRMPDMFPALRSLLVISDEKQQTDWTKVTDLKECYRVFER